MLLDTHAHLDDPRLFGELQAVLSRAAGAGVTAVVTCGTDLASSRRAVAIAGLYPGSPPGSPRVVATVGIHPHEAARVDDLPAALEELAGLAAEGPVAAIGEIGLDYHHELAPRPRQRELFARQLELAARLRLPVVVHSRQAVDEVLDLMEQTGTTRGVLHAFAGELAQARRAIALGLHLGVGGMVTFTSAGALRETLRQLPVERLVVETDAPYLAPVPYRGRRNEPAFVVEVARRLAELLGLTLEELATVTTANARRVFGPRL